LGCLKTFLYFARDEFGIKPNTEEFDKFKVSNQESDFVVLSKAEIKGLSEMDLTGNPVLAKTRDLFLIRALTGMRFSDMKTLSKEHLKGQIIEKTL
jgi:integrase